jgi:hypothetical protein
MRFMKLAGWLAALVLIVACFMPWAQVESIHTTLSGVETGNTGFGKPAYLHFILSALFIIFSLVPKVWSARGNLVVTAINLAWAIRNYLIISLCRGGECPIRKPGLYLIVAGSIVMLLASLFPDTRLKK